MIWLIIALQMLEFCSTFKIAANNLLLMSSIMQEFVTLPCQDNAVWASLLKIEPNATYYQFPAGLQVHVSQPISMSSEEITDRETSLYHLLDTLFFWND